MLHYNLCVRVLELGGNLYKKGYSITIFMVLRMLGTVMLMKGYNLQGMSTENVQLAVVLPFQLYQQVLSCIQNKSIDALLDLV